MLKKTVKYVDFNGTEREEDVYFNLTDTERLTFISKNGGGNFKDLINRIATSMDNEAIVRMISEIILAAYGEKSDDGKYFMKSPEIALRFQCSPIYDMIYQEIAFDDKKAMTFINAVVGADATKPQDHLPPRND